MLNVIINCIRFCGAFELALRGHDETESSNNPGVFRGLINFAQELDLALKEHMESSNVFKGTSKTIQNELLDVMLDIVRDEIKSEIDQAPFLATIADETTDIAKFAQLATVFRYVCADGSVVERFWGYKLPGNLKADGITAALKEDIIAVLGNKNDKLVCQAYDGAAVMAGHLNGVQTQIKLVYPHAHYIHCKCHEFNLAIQKSCCANPRTSVFFNSLHSIPTFFAHSSDRVTALKATVAKRVPRAPAVRWNYNTRTVNMVYENQDALYDCFCELESNEHTAATIEAASNLKRTLEDEEFCSWLGFFHRIMPHAEIFFKQLQARNLDAALSQQLVQDFVTHVQAVRFDISEGKLNMQESENRRRRRRRGENQQTLNAAAIEVCDTIITQITERFSFTGHLEASSLVFSGNFARFEKNFPTSAFNTTLTLFPMLDKVVLETELRLLYQRKEFRSATGAIPILKFILANNLKDIFCETVKLLQIVCTMPMTSAEAERVFSTLKRIKTFLRNSMGEERLNALAMLSIEKQFINSIIDFNKKVIDRFAGITERRMDFSYKKI
ncbi:UNVERIFIED_CONTAM: hypothetical protein B566_EDAN018909 [Ephemera danica]|nr:hypothetical protein B566_EDAN018909 [Ephemera danica]